MNGDTANRLSEQYGVTGRTIKRDGEIASVIGAIGRQSPDAKREILSGATRISRRQLREMSSTPDKDIAATASKIVAGTFEQNRPNSSAASDNNAADGSTLGAHRSLEEVFTGMSDTFMAELNTLSRNHEATELKEALRSHINKLEEFYREVG